MPTGTLAQTITTPLNPYFKKSLRHCMERFVLPVVFVSLAACKADAPTSSVSHAEQGLLSAALSNSGEQLVIGSINHGASLWTTSDTERRYNWNHQSGGYSQVTRIRFSEDSKHAVTAEPQSLVLWNVEDGKGDALWSTYSEVLDIAVVASADYALLALADHSAKLFDLRRGGTLKIFNHNDRVNSVDVHSATNRVATGSDDQAVKIWELWNEEPAASEVDKVKKALFTIMHEEPVQLVRFSRDGTRLFTLAQYDGAKVWDTNSGALVGELPISRYAKRRGANIRSVRFSNDGTQLLTGSADREIKLWDLNSFKMLRSWKTPARNTMDPQGSAVLDVAFNNSGGYSAITSDGIRHLLL